VTQKRRSRSCMEKVCRKHTIGHQSARMQSCLSDADPLIPDQRLLVTICGLNQGVAILEYFCGRANAECVDCQHARQKAWQAIAIRAVVILDALQFGIIFPFQSELFSHRQWNQRESNPRNRTTHLKSFSSDARTRGSTSWIGLG
jgi:hypothetical protein